MDDSPPSSAEHRMIFRSEEMSLAQLYIQSDSAYNCVAELGELGLFQFRDLNPDVSSFQRKYVKEVRRCDEMERKLRFLETEIRKDYVPMLEARDDCPVPVPKEMMDLELTFDKLEAELRDVIRNEDTLKKNVNELTELKHVLRKAQLFFEENHDDQTAEATLIPLDISRDATAELSLLMQLNFVMGVIRRERFPAFERLLWRVCRGNVLIRQAELEDPGQCQITGETISNTVFIIFFQGDLLKLKIKKICEGFTATLYPCPNTAQERREMSIGVLTRIEDLKTVLGQTQDHRHRVLVSASKNVQLWLKKVRKMKAVYHSLNLFNLDGTQRCLVAEGWCPTDDLDKIRLALIRGTEASGSQVPSILHVVDAAENPPTYHKSNKYTKGFQNIVDSYGMASYREINPAPYTMITFPFLFAVMFGDMGHGLVMLMAGLFFIFTTFFNGRYVILLMGLFSIYTGFIYNDVFSKSMNILSSSAWKNSYSQRFLREHLTVEGQDRPYMLVPERAYNNLRGPYPYGVDPVWNLAETNKLSFLNSMKMKVSVILGVAQMAFGLLLSLYNHRYFKSDLDINFMFIPQALFLGCIFVYLCVQIIAKWVLFTAEPGYIFGIEYPGANCAPSLLIGLINMFMQKPRPSGFDTPACYLNFWYPGQSFIESLFLSIAICCVPVMLLAKPYLLWREDRLRRQRNQSNLSVRVDIHQEDVEVIHAEELPPGSKANHTSHGHASSGPFDLGDVMVYQAIHTIEFVLGCVSHTASYLRLWALSLAHAQLSEVLWTMVFRHAFAFDGYTGAVLTYVLFFVFFFLSVGILVLMEGLSAFLHALRLHWVEFQSKFYGGHGYPFTPFRFRSVLEEAQKDDDQS
ncbi:unnamed protein product, partial [Mesorhabditis spiculigera]